MRPFPPDLILGSNRSPLFPILLCVGTFKLKKLALQREGYDPDQITDPLYYYDSVKGLYVPLDSSLHRDIVHMRMRL